MVQQKDQRVGSPDHKYSRDSCDDVSLGIFCVRFEKYDSWYEEAKIKKVA